MKQGSGSWLRAPLLLAMAILASCQASPEQFREVRGGVTVESVFVAGDHGFRACLKEYGDSLVELTDGTLFFDRDSKLRVTPPRGEKMESYHVHLLHRVGGDVLDFVARQNAAGLVELDLSRFDQPERLVIASSAFRIAGRDGDPGKGTAVGTREALTPPYAMSFKLLASDQAEAVMAIQNFRYDLESEQGKLSLFVQPFNRRDMLLTWVDREKRLGGLIQEDPYIHLVAQDGYVPPRLAVDVLTSKGALWERSGTWHLPENVGRAGGDEKPFAFRIHGKELITFAAPARVDFTLPEGPHITTARIEAKYSGIAKEDALRLVLATQYPTPGRNGEAAIRLQAHEVKQDTKKSSYVVDVSDLDSSQFPLTSSLAHRFVQPWKLSGGFFGPQPPRGRATVSLKDLRGSGKLHARVVAPRYASHYDFIAFLGDGKWKSTVDSFLKSLSGGPGSPNTTVPPFDQPIVDLHPTAIRPPAGPSDPAPGVGPAATGGGGGGAGGAGKDTQCGCGPGPAPGLPSPGCPSKHKCKGTCARACPDNGHCKDDGGGRITLQFPCPPSPKGCRQDRKSGECKCGPHPWNMNAAMDALRQLVPGAADYSWFGRHNGWAPCDETTEIGRVRVSFWAPAGFGMTHISFIVLASFGPCVKVEMGGGGPGGGPPPGPPPKAGGQGAGEAPGPGAGNGGVGFSGPGDAEGSITLRPSLPGGPMAATLNGFVIPGVLSNSHPVGPNDPNTMVQVGRISEALGIVGPLDSGFLRYDEGTLAGILASPAASIAEVYRAGNESSVARSMANTGTELDLPFFLEGLLQSVAAGGGGGGVVPPPVPPIPPGCGALGIEFILGLYALQSLLRRILR